jgi:small-conductance mechanosensitive channel
VTWTILPGLRDVSAASVLWSAVAVLGTFIAARYAARAVTRLGHRLPSVEQDQILQASRVARYVVLMVGATVVLAILGAPVEPLIAVVLLVIAAVALMARGVADNIGAGLVLQARHSVKIGDLVTSCGYTGRVADLTSRSVVLETFDGTTVHLPNQRVMKDPLINASTLGRVRSELQVRLPVTAGDVVHDSEERLLDGAGATDGVLPHPAPDLLLVGLDTVRATFTLRYWHAPDDTAEVGSRVARRIQRACQAHGTEFALAWPPPPPPMTPPGAL